MKYIIRFFTVIFILAVSGCSGKHLVENKEYRDTVNRFFSQTEKLAQNRKDKLFSIFNKKLTLQQIEALKFLYAFMPLSDLADYNGEYFLANVDKSLQAKENMPWGDSIPEDIFLHYVLPIRVNNENLDSFRIIYYDEIINRIKGMDIIDAALEINHWCHEKVTYQPADSRTSAPMSTILSARGRCGEESTFAVAAMRAAGIPARQVYTPRWAHCDDNHAWIEIWKDNKWYYMGACEPEAVIDRGWFTEPAKRAMLVNTKSFGAFSGTENIINRHDKYTEVNNLSKYAITKKITVKTLNTSGNKIKNAIVEFELYNYAEFYPLAIVSTDSNGISSFETGLGDLLIWGRKNDDFDFKKISVAATDTIVLTPGQKSLDNKTFYYDLSVPVRRTNSAELLSSLVEANNKRIDSENQIRQKYTDSWIRPAEAKALALRNGLDSSEVADIIGRSMGNYNEIISFLTGTPDSLKNLAVSLLKTVADKDLRDAKSEVLSDHLLHCRMPEIRFLKEGDSFVTQYVLNPRLANEMLTSWRGYLQKVLPADLQRNAMGDPNVIVNYINENIKIADDENYYKTPITPVGVNELKLADTKSRAIYFVAICRTLGIPSRFEPGSNVPQYFFNSEWHDVYFADQKKPSLQKGFVKLTSSDKNPVPEYYKHFTLARFENGRYITLEYDENKRVTDFKDELQLTPGHYMFVTGNRINDSKILSSLSFFDLAEGEHKAIEIKLSKDKQPPEILGKIDLENVIFNITGDKEKSARIAGKGAVLFWIEPEKEPSKHVLNDLPLLINEFNSWPGYFVFLSTDIKEYNTMVTPGERKNFPSNSILSNDNDLKILKNLSMGISLNQVSFPLVLLVNNKGEILFISGGYRIGIGEQILKYLTIAN
ncbi:MAG: transglutaminase domain-containing protein [Bacteroidia bacterium]|nr:transglutaminase domain-containing protein [Bacteroidia bacterium]